MSFGIAFGFLSGATGQGSHYDPNSFAIGVSALFGAACGAIGILLSRVRQMKRELRDLEARLDEAADRNWEISEAEERAKSFFEAQDDLIVRRDGSGAISYVNDAFCKLAGRERGRPCSQPRFALPVLEHGETTCSPTAREPSIRKFLPGRGPLGCLARGDNPRRRRKRDAERRPRRHRPGHGRARARRSARSGGSGEAAQNPAFSPSCHTRSGRRLTAFSG